MYRDPPARATLTFLGRGHFDNDEEVRNRVFELMPEVEQRHDLDRTGAALIIDLDRVNGQHAARRRPDGAAELTEIGPTPRPLPATVERGSRAIVPSPSQGEGSGARG